MHCVRIYIRHHRTSNYITNKASVISSKGRFRESVYNERKYISGYLVSPKSLVPLQQHGLAKKFLSCQYRLLMCSLKECGSFDVFITWGPIITPASLLIYKSVVVTGTIRIGRTQMEVLIIIIESCV